MWECLWSTHSLVTSDLGETVLLYSSGSQTFFVVRFLEEIVELATQQQQKFNQTENINVAYTVKPPFTNVSEFEQLGFRTEILS